jgi:hypothetical protein
MGNKVPHKAKSNVSAIPSRSKSEKIMIVLSILIAVSMVAGLFVGIF